MTSREIGGRASSSAGPAAQLPVMLVIAERLTGTAFAPEWLDETHVLMDVLNG